MTATTSRLQVGSDTDRPDAIPAPRFRPDLDGLRAVAVLMVVLYHADVPGLYGGFISVDIFYVVSGYLITQILTGELDRSGSILLRGFWARRVRRLLPAVLTVTVFVLALSLGAYSVLEWKDVAADALATSLFWSNQLFASRATDYFAVGRTASPLLHTWSLAVEEQFYLVWPLLLLGVERLRRRSRADGVRVRALVVATISAASLVWSLSLSAEGSPYAFYSAASRAWELGAGALLAIGATGVARATARPSTRICAGVLGALVLALGLVTIDQRTEFPGRAALLPVVATLLVIVAGMSGGSWVTSVLSRAGLQRIGRLSYSWYLWHWPIVVLGVAYLGHDSTTTRVILVTSALAPATVMHHLIENPIRRSPMLARSPRRTFVLGGGLVATAVLAAGAFWLVADVRLREPRLAALLAAREDHPPLDPRCASADVHVLLAACVSGDPNGSRTVLLLGDSHAASWQPAVDVAARSRRLRVILSAQGNCPAVGPGWNQQLPSCARRIDAVPQLISALHPDLVVLSDSMGYLGGLTDGAGHVLGADRQLLAWQEAHRNLASVVTAANARLVDFLDVPRFASDPLECLASHSSALSCAMPLEEALRRVGPARDAERAGLAAAGHGTTWDPTSLLCTDASCPPAVDGTVRYNDESHLTTAFSRTLAGPVGQALDEALAASVPPG